MAKGLYKGFSLRNFVRNRTFSLTDIALVEEDILNYIYTSLGTRLRMPTFGTNIPNTPFQMLDDVTLAEVRDGLKSAVNYDPRVELISLEVIPSPDTNLITAIVNLFYVELNMAKVTYLNISTDGTLAT